MVSHINQAVIKQLRLRIELDNVQYPGKKKLKIKGKELECVPAELFLLNNDIEILDLSPEREACLFYHLDEVPSDIGRLSNLVMLMLDTNELGFVPDEICKLVNLEKLSLSNNFLSELPQKFSNLRKLKSLHLANNSFYEFPQMICDLKNLEYLDMCDNNISVLPEEIGSLKRLEALLLFLNELKELPNGICELEELRTLWIGSNRIEELPSRFGNLHELDWGIRHTPSTALDGNPLVHPPTKICKKGIDDIAIFLREHRPDSRQTTTSSTM